MTCRPASRARLSASRLLPERAPPMISSFMAGILGEGRRVGHRYNIRFDNTEPGASAAQFRGGPAAVIGDRRRNCHCQRETDRAGRRGPGTIRKPEDVSIFLIKACGQGFAAAFGKTPPRGPFAFGESDAFV